MANYKTVKLATETGLLGIEFIKRDATIREVIIGGVRISSDYGLTVSVLQPYESVKRDRVTATIEGFGTKVLHFEQYGGAAEKVRELEKAGAAVTLETVSVLIDDAGNIVGEARDNISASDATSDVPF